MRAQKMFLALTMVTACGGVGGPVLHPSDAAFGGNPSGSGGATPGTGGSLGTGESRDAGTSGGTLGAGGAWGTGGRGAGGATGAGGSLDASTFDGPTQCEYEGKYYTVGSTIYLPDGCNYCICQTDSRFECTAKICGVGGAPGSGGRTGAGGTTGTGGSGGAGGNGTGGTGGGGTSGLACPSDLPPGPPWQFCVGVALYEGTAECYDAGVCACVPGRFLYCLEGCVKNPNDEGGSCRSGLVQCPSSGYYKPICFGNALHDLATACPAGGTCTCKLMFREQCTNRCVDLPDGSGQCE